MRSQLLLALLAVLALYTILRQPVGSIAPSILGGILSFKDVRIVTKDASITISDGYLLFRYWVRKFRKTANTGDTRTCRLMLQLNGFALHVFNRTGVYQTLHDLVDPLLNPTGRPSSDSAATDVSVSSAAASTPTTSMAMPLWKTVFPAIRVRIAVGRYVVGMAHSFCNTC